MPNLDAELRERLIKRFGPNIDLRARPGLLRELVEEVVRKPAIFIGASDSHYKGDIHTKEYGGPGGPTYERQYLRGVARPEANNELTELIGELHSVVDQMVVDALRQRLKELDAHK